MHEIPDAMDQYSQEETMRGVLNNCLARHVILRKSLIGQLFIALCMQSLLMPCVCQGDSMDMNEVMAVRNAMAVTTDLRQPMNLGDQLLHKSGLSSDVGQAMFDLLQVSPQPGTNLAQTMGSIHVKGFLPSLGIPYSHSQPFLLSHACHFPDRITLVSFFAEDQVIDPS